MRARARASRHSQRLLEPGTAQPPAPKPRTHNDRVSPTALADVPGVEQRRELVLRNGALHGNRQVGRLLSPLQSGLAHAPVQRSIFDSLEEAWDTVADAASDVWDAVTGAGKAKPGGGAKAGSIDFAAGDSAVVTDPKAYMRTPPPALESTGVLLPLDRRVEILQVHPAGGKMYAEVREVLDENVSGAAMQGWTRASNLKKAAKGSPSGPDTPVDPGVDPVVDPDDVVINDPEHDDDATKRSTVTELAKLNDEEKAQLKAAGKENIVADIEAELAAIEQEKADRATAKADKTLSKSDRNARVKELTRSLSKHDRTIESLLKGLSRDIRAKVEMDLEMREDGTDPEAWFAGLYPNATFLGLEIKGNRAFMKSRKLGGVHEELYVRLKAAEQTLAAQTGLSGTALAKELGVAHVSGLREVEPASGKSQGVGLHSYGLAIDIDGDDNPYLGFAKKSVSEPVLRRARQLVQGVALGFDVNDVAVKGEGKDKDERAVDQARKMWALLHDTSEALKVYMQFETATDVTLDDGTKLDLATLAEAYAVATGDAKTVAEWQAQITSDRKQLALGDFGDRGPEQGLMNLDERLVVALTQAGLAWGGAMGKAGKDIMHFAYRDGTIKKGPQ